MPDGSLMTDTVQLEPIPLKPLKIEPMREWYLSDLVLLRGEIARFRALQSHGRLVCGWSNPNPVQ